MLRFRATSWFFDTFQFFFLVHISSLNKGYYQMSIDDTASKELSFLQTDPKSRIS